MKNGEPSAAIRRYSTAPSATSPSPPINVTAGAASTATPTSRSAPMPSASHSACEPSAVACSSRPAPCRRATCAVVPYVRKLKIVNAVESTVAAIASDASWLVPRWPTIAVSTST